MPKSFSSAEIVRLLTAGGWVEVARKGSHAQFKRTAMPGRVTVPMGRKDIPVGTVRSIFRQAGWPWPP